MRFLSVCSGIDAASVAWSPLGWSAAAFSEIEPFPSAVLAHHYPDVPNLGDMTKFKEWQIGAIDLLVGGTPCQSFSVAGLRKGLDDPRGDLMLTYAAIAAEHRPEWLVWENVPGVLSSNGGRDFASLLGLLAGQVVDVPVEGWSNTGVVPGIPDAYGLAWRVLDAQFFGVPQRRRRVFLVGRLGDWRRAAAVLLERHGLSGHPAPRREAREVAPTIPSRSSAGGGLGTDFDCDGGLINCSPDGISGTMSAKWSKGTGGPAGDEHYKLVAPTVFSIMPMNSGKDYKARAVDVSQPLMAGGPVGGNQGGDVVVTHALTGEGFDASEDGTGRGTPLIPVEPFSGPISGPIDTDGSTQAVAFAQNQRDEVRTMDVAGALAAEPGMKQQTFVSVPNVAQPIRTNGYNNSDHGMEARMHINTGSAVRRLTPRECERLQGFPDDYTLIPFGRAIRAEKITEDWIKYLMRGDRMNRDDVVRAAADGNRYKSLGNSMAVPVMAWIGRRIEAVRGIA